MPAGWRLSPAAGLRVFDGGRTLVGGFPLRVLTLSPRGADLTSAWLAGQPVSPDPGARELARRLLAAGLADPDPPAGARSTAEVTIVVPVYADAERLASALAPIASDATVIVVDDGSPDGTAIAAVAERRGARYVRLAENRGASAARNVGAGLASTPLVAFLDADCVPPPGFPGRLIDHLADPAVALVAPRIVAAGDRRHGPIAAYERTHSALDMGARPSPVRPYSPVWYVPSAAMVARRDALGAGFDEHLSLGEDVDLVWRLHDAGWQLRYDPRVAVAHDARVAPATWYRRRVAYNESVALLLRRHPERLPVLFLTPAAALAWAAALGGQPGPLLALATARVRHLRRPLRGRVPGSTARAVGMGAEVTVHEGRDLARAVAGPWAPFALALLGATRGRKRQALARRLGALVIAMALGDWLADRPDLDPLRYAALRLADESSRGLGIWIGCARERDFRGLLARHPPRASQR